MSSMIQITPWIHICKLKWCYHLPIFLTNWSQTFSLILNLTTLLSTSIPLALHCCDLILSKQPSYLYIHTCGLSKINTCGPLHWQSHIFCYKLQYSLLLIPRHGQNHTWSIRLKTHPQWQYVTIKQTY